MRRLLLTLLLLAIWTPAWAQGWGSRTLGGAGLPVTAVTNLNDSGPGSLRMALSAGSRTVTFTVGGDIVLSSVLDVAGSHVTVEGSTAPGGVRIWSHGLRVVGQSDVILRDLTVVNPANDGFQIRDGSFHVLLDHVTVLDFEGPYDGLIDVTAGAHDVTVRDSVLYGNSGSKAMLIDTGAYRVSVIGNLFLASSRTPKVSGAGPSGETVAEIVGNVISHTDGAGGTTVVSGATAAILGNYYAWAFSLNDRLTVQGATGYARGNLSFDGSSLDHKGTTGVTLAGPTVKVSVGRVDPACQAAWQVLRYAGARPRTQPWEIPQQWVTTPPCVEGP